LVFFRAFDCDKEKHKDLLSDKIILRQYADYLIRRF